MKIRLFRARGGLNPRYFLNFTSAKGEALSQFESYSTQIVQPVVLPSCFATEFSMKA